MDKICRKPPQSLPGMLGVLNLCKALLPAACAGDSLLHDTLLLIVVHTAVSSPT